MSRTDANREGDDHRSEPATRTRRVGLLLAMVGLWSVAVLGPYLELAAEPAFVLAHGLSRADTVVFGVGLVVGFPLLVAAGSWTVGRVANTPVAWCLAVSILAGLAITGLLRELGWLSLGLGVTAGVLVHVRRWHQTLAVTVLATFVALIVWFGPSDVGTYIRAGDAGAAAAATVPRPVPVVVIVFDELPVHALLSADHLSRSFALQSGDSVGSIKESLSRGSLPLHDEPQPLSPLWGQAGRVRMVVDETFFRDLRAAMGLPSS